MNNCFPPPVATGVTGISPDIASAEFEQKDVNLIVNSGSVNSSKIGQVAEFSIHVHADGGTLSVVDDRTQYIAHFSFDGISVWCNIFNVDFGSAAL